MPGNLRFNGGNNIQGFKLIARRKQRRVPIPEKKVIGSVVFATITHYELLLNITLQENASLNFLTNKSWKA